MTRKKYEKPLTLDMSFDEALGRYADTDPTEVDHEIEGAASQRKGELIEELLLGFEKAANHDEHGEYWLARQLSPLLGYKDYRNFLNAVEKAKAACTEVGEAVDDHFGDVTVMIPTGKGAKREADDIQLTRFACYLIAQNGDPTKRPEIAAAQTYFAIQTRRQELTDEALAERAALSDDEKRVFLRDKLKEHNKLLAQAAKTAGVTNFPNFMGAGLKGLYGGLNQEQVARRKGVPKGKHLDFAGHEELAANYFKATQTEAKLKRDGTTKPTAANKAHKEVGEAIRKTIESLGGTMPEDLKAEPDHVDDVRKRIGSGAKKVDKKG